MKNKSIFNIISYIIILLLLLSTLILSILGNINRKGYLTDFQLDENLSGSEIYSYNFRIRYYSKIFRNSDIYGVYADTNKIIKDNNFIKEIKFPEKGSPFGILTSTKELQYDEKIDNIDYKLKIKVNILILSILLIIYIVILSINNKASLYFFLLLSISIYLTYLIVCSVNIIFWDEWELLLMYNKIKNSNLNIFELLSYLFSQHNEHRIFFPRIISLPILALTKWNTSVINYISFIIYIIGCFIVIKYFYKKNGNKVSTLMIFLFAILFSMKQHENITWAFQIAWFMIFTISITSFYLFYLYTKENKKIYIFFSIICAIISSFSSAQGLIIWLSFFILFILLILSGEIKNLNKLSFILLFLFGIICFILYFYNYTKPTYHKELFSGNLVNTFFLSISSPIYNSMLLGILLFILSIFITIFIIYKKTVYDNIFPLLLLIFSYGFISSIVTSRSWAGVASRYITFTNLLPISLFLLYFNNFNITFNKYKKIIFAVSIIILLNNSIPILNNLENEYRRKKEMQYILRNYNKTSLSNLKKLYPFNSYEDAQFMISILEKNHFNVFNSKYDYLDDNFKKKGE